MSAPPRRGAPRPVDDAELVPPAHFTPEQRRAFDEAVRTRPGFWCAADRFQLEAWSVAVAFIREAHAAWNSTDPVEQKKAAKINPVNYRAAIRVARDIGKSLRLNAYDRQVSDGASATPELLPHEDDRRGEAALPWQAPAPASSAAPPPWQTAPRAGNA